MKELAGKVAFVTGGANGIGLALAQRLVREGMRVAIADIRAEPLHAALAQLGASAGQAIAIPLDVSDRAAMARAADQVEAALGPVHLLCNNAGVNLFVPMEDATYEDWDWVMGVNLGGVINGVRTFVPRIKAHGEGGHVVNTASMASIIAGPGAGIYTASKFAVRGLTESLRYSLAPFGIGVSALCPGLVRSNIHDSDAVRPAALSGDRSLADPEFMKRLKQLHEVGMDPAEVAERTLEGIRNNDPFIFPHPEFKTELRDLFDEMLAYVPEGDVDPQRLAFEEMRRKNKRAALH